MVVEWKRHDGRREGEGEVYENKSQASDSSDLGWNDVRELEEKKMSRDTSDISEYVALYFPPDDS